jgi:uncharacterized protein
MATTTKRKFGVVTGGSSGIGFELARQLVEHDYDVLIAADGQDVHGAADKLGATASQVDLTTYDGVENLWSAIEEVGRPVDALVLNAGFGVHGDFLTTNLSDEIKMMSLNTISVVHLAKRVLPGMVAARSGRILITSSVVGTMPATYMAVYGGTKAFDLQFAEALREELKHTGVSVTAFQPGATDTRFFARAHMQGTKVGADSKDDPALVAKQAFAAMMKGKDKAYVGSWKSRILGLANELLPETLKARQHGRIAKPGSAKTSGR